MYERSTLIVRIQTARRNRRRGVSGNETAVEIRESERQRVERANRGAGLVHQNPSQAADSVKHSIGVSDRRLVVMVRMRTATPKDLAIIVDTAARSLDAEAMLRWSFGEERFEERIRRHFAHYDGENARRGWIRMAADGVGIAVWIPPGAREEHEAIGPAAPGDEAEILGDNVERHAAFWGWIQEHEPPEPLLYLSHIGVAPERQ